MGLGRALGPRPRHICPQATSEGFRVVGLGWALGPRPRHICPEAIP